MCKSRRERRAERLFYGEWRDCSREAEKLQGKEIGRDCRRERLEGKRERDCRGRGIAEE